MQRRRRLVLVGVRAAGGCVSAGNSAPCCGIWAVLRALRVLGLTLDQIPRAGLC